MARQDRLQPATLKNGNNLLPVRVITKRRHSLTPRNHEDGEHVNGCCGVFDGEAVGLDAELNKEQITDRTAR